MQTFSKYIGLLIFLIAGTLCFYRFFHRLTKFETKISQVNIVPDYLRHKDSIHYALTFKINNYRDRAGIYLGNKYEVSENKIANRLDTFSVYTVFLDETVPPENIGIIGVKEISLKGKKIYQKSQIMYLFLGLGFVLIGLLIFLKRSRNSDNIS